MHVYLCFFPPAVDSKAKWSSETKYFEDTYESETKRLGLGLLLSVFLFLCLNQYYTTDKRRAPKIINKIFSAVGLSLPFSVLQIAIIASNSIMFIPFTVHYIFIRILIVLCGIARENRLVI